MNSGRYPLLEQISQPADLRNLLPSDLPKLAEEVREFLIECVAQTGGHLAANLGVVELTLALHYIFDTPSDRLVWDVGHQCYTHKIVTGRRKQMMTLRQPGGLSGFPKRSESEYDAFGVGHSSTSISAALAMAVAAKAEGSERQAIAVIGDGAMTAGMAFEALNHAGAIEADLLVILNDNDMSISANVGALSNYFARILSGKLYSTMREGGKKVLKGVPSLGELARRAEEHMKGMVVPGTLFEELGFNYIGPVDGHDLPTLISTLSNLRDLKGPRLLHVVTRKGKGYAPAEADPSTFHGIGPFDPETGNGVSKATSPTYTQIFSNWLCDQAAADSKLMGVTPAMCEGSGLTDFEQLYPERYFDVGIAEQHAITFAAGLATEGLHPVVAIYSSFLQRGYDQLIHDVALQKLPVLFAIDRAGIVGPDGATHDGIFDLTFLGCVPDLVVMTPSDEAECRLLLATGYGHDGPAAVRYPRGQGPGAEVSSDLERVAIGRGVVRREGKRIALLAFGTPLAAAMAAAEQLDATVVDMRFAKPLDEALIAQLVKEHRLLLTLEEGVVRGGAGSAVAALLAEIGCSVQIGHLGLSDQFQPHGDRAAILAANGLSCDAIVAAANGYNRSSSK